VGERALGASRARADCAVITADVVHSELARMVEPDSCGARRECAARRSRARLDVMGGVRFN
jgi:hypothetical protein